jgi:nucleotide-binding universal stress UspA family protein
VKTIIVGVDGSPDAACALEWTASIAAAMGARVIAVHAVGMLEHERGDPSGEHLRPKLAAWMAALHELPSDRVDSRLEQGDPVSVLLRAADDDDADLVVVGRRGAGGRAGLVLGSTSLQLAERCSCPVVIVPRSRS